MIRQALILAGGRGSRLGSLTQTLPKPMLQVAGKPLLEHLIFNLVRFGIPRIVLSIGYLHDVIESYFQDGRKLGVELEYSREATPLGTGGGLRNASHLLDDSFLVLNGDTFFDCNYLDLARMLSPGIPAVVALRRVLDVSRYGSVDVEGGRVRFFLEKGRTGPGYISAGVYALTRAALEYLPRGFSSIETDLFPVLTARNILAAQVGSGFFIDIGLPETLNAAHGALSVWQHKPCLFLDAGAIMGAKDMDVTGLSPFRWADEAIHAIKWCNDNGHLVMLFFPPWGAVENCVDPNAMPDIVAQLQAELCRYAAHIDAYHHFFGHSSDWIKNCLCAFNREDGLGGMIRMVMSQWKIDVSNSVLMRTGLPGESAGNDYGVPESYYSGSGLLTWVRQRMRPCKSEKMEP